MRDNLFEPWQVFDLDQWNSKSLTLTSRYVTDTPKWKIVIQKEANFINCFRNYVESTLYVFFLTYICFLYLDLFCYPSMSPLYLVEDIFSISQGREFLAYFWRKISFFLYFFLFAYFSSWRWYSTIGIIFCSVLSWELGFT